MEDSILKDIKHRVGPSAEFEYFDVDIIDAINAAFSILTQIGAGPTNGFQITDDTAKWSDFIDDITVINLVKKYIYNKVLLTFDFPNNSSRASALVEQNAELESRISLWVDDQSGAI